MSLNKCINVQTEKNVPSSWKTSNVSISLNIIKVRGERLNIFTFRLW